MINKISAVTLRSMMVPFLLLVFFNVSSAEIEPPRNPNSAKGCAICHYRWVDTFFIEGRDSDLVAYTSEKLVATPEMCMSCHDGSIMDSRARMTKGIGHKTGVLPPSEIKIPELFPLDEEGKMECATCHTAHGVPSGPDTEETIFLRTSNRDSVMCRMCHPDREGGVSRVNHPDGIMKSEIPQNLISLGAHAGKSGNKIGCETCHAAHGSSHESYLIQSAKRSGLCLDCHRDKDIFTPDGQPLPYHVLNVKPFKANISEELVKLGAKFGDNGIVICLSCHKVHNNKQKKHLLLTGYDNNSTLCLSCHQDQRFIVNTKHNLLHTAPDERNLQGETVAEAGICSACHLPHKPARILTKNADFTSQLCFSCHSKDKIAKNYSLEGSQHPLKIDTLSQKYKNKLALPLYDEYGLRNTNREMTCLTCHDPHRWQPDSTKGEIRPDIKGNRTTSFLRKQSPDICNECHQEKFYVAGSKHDLSKVASEEKNILSQSPSEAGLCGNCHLVHNAQKVFLWARKMSTENGNIILGLCNGCHNEKGVANKKVIKDYSHPINIAATEKGLSTTLPLFDNNGKKTIDGVIGCITCHDPHRWDPLLSFARDHFDIEGNSKNSFLRLETSPSPRLCENCHLQKAYLEKTDHDLIISAPFSENRIGQTPIESGTCGVCHLVHNSENKIRLWAQGFGAGNNVMEMMCNFCHSKDGSAKNKTPQVYSHPREKLIKNNGHNISGLPDYFPLFHGGTGEPVNTGNLSCPSCHNAHQWDPENADKGKGGNIEGNLSNSFLRPKASRTLCLDCHKTDALSKFEYFHDPTKRKFKGIDEMFFQ